MEDLDTLDHLDQAEQWVNAAADNLSDAATTDDVDTGHALEIARLHIQLWHAKQSRDYQRAVAASRAAAPVIPPMPLPGYPQF